MLPPTCGVTVANVPPQMPHQQQGQPPVYSVTAAGEVVGSAPEAAQAAVHVYAQGQSAAGERGWTDGRGLWDLSLSFFATKRLTHTPLSVSIFNNNTSII
jgi:hypothetical protein